jgi:hypothetical protein
MSRDARLAIRTVLAALYRSIYVNLGVGEHQNGDVIRLVDEHRNDGVIRFVCECRDMREADKPDGNEMDVRSEVVASTKSMM